MYKQTKLLALITAFITFFTCSLTAYAAKSVSDLKSEMQERNSEIKQKEKEINAKKSEKNSEVEKRNSLDLQISGLLDDIDSVQALIDEKEVEIQKKNGEINELNNQIEENDARLKDRLVAMYEYGSTSYIQLLLESDGIADLITRVSIVKSVYDYDKEVINGYVQSKQLVEEAKQVIVNEQNEQVESKEILEDKKSELDTLKKEKDEIINKLNGDIKSLEEEEARMEADYNAMQKELNAALSAASAPKVKSNYSGGKFCWPSAVSQRITSSYGYRTHPISGAKKLHRGIDIGAGLGTNVLAAEAGTVITSGWNNSYGYYVTINHGNGYTTLYAHNSKLLVSKGDTVTRGQAIAKCGSTGNSTGPHIHFEVSLNGKLQNPMDFF